MPLISIIKEGFDKEYDYFRVKKENSIRFNKLHNELWKYAIVKRKPTPAKILDEFLMLLDDVNIEVNEMYNKKEDEVITRVLEYFKNQSDYHFSKKYYEEITGNYITENFESLVSGTVFYLVRNHCYQMHEKGEDEYNNSGILIRDAYERIDSELKGVYKYSDYQKAVLSGYIAICFEFTLFDTRKSITNARIFQAARNALKKKPTTK